jgi:hypothetical protein
MATAICRSELGAGDGLKMPLEGRDDLHKVGND